MQNKCDYKFMTIRSVSILLIEPMKRIAYRRGILNNRKKCKMDTMRLCGLAIQLLTLAVRRQVPITLACVCVRVLVYRAMATSF